MPHDFIGPIIILPRPIYDWIESGVVLFAIQNVLGFLVLLVADAVGVPAIAVQAPLGGVLGYLSSPGDSTGRAGPPIPAGSRC